MLDGRKCDITNESCRFMIFFILLELKSVFPASHDSDRNLAVSRVRDKGLAAALHKQALQVLQGHKQE